MARLEREATAFAQRRMDRRERGPQVIVGYEALERVARHRRELELAAPPGLRRGALHPLDLAPPPGPGQRGTVRVEADEPAGMTLPPCTVQHGTGATPDVQDRPRRHDQLAISLATELTEALRDTLRVAESRGHRLLAPGPDTRADDTMGPTLPAAAFG
ncbi:hypothetical protein GCM10020367_19920 [Streptomyces sannanensis]|uniref:Uncharacterized protein n=1 Tax=Streptomyces sannanensis TaxID=285536 RepID=A0ABP6S8R7_9ACTN